MSSAQNPDVSSLSSLISQWQFENLEKPISSSNEGNAAKHLQRPQENVQTAKDMKFKLDLCFQIAGR